MKKLNWVQDIDVIEWHCDNTIMLTKDGWYYSDETFANARGPFSSMQEAKLQLCLYCAIELDGHQQLNSPQDIKKGMELIFLDERPFLERYQKVTVATVGKKNDTFDVELSPGQFLIVHKNDYCYFVEA